MNNNLQIKKLKDCCIEKGKYGINAPAVEYDENLPAYLRITDIDENAKYILENKVSVNGKDYKNFILQENEIVFARTGATVGKSYLYNKKDGILVYAGYLIKFRPNQDVLNSKYLSYYTHTKPYFDWVKLMSTRSGQPGINAEEYGNLKIILPPLPEQQKIASILSTQDEVIEKLEKLIELKEKQKKGLMQRLLTGKVRLKGFNDKWSIGKIEDLIIYESKTRHQSSIGKTVGKYPFFINNSGAYSKFLDEFDFDGEYIIANTGGVAFFDYYNGKFSGMSDCFIFSSKINTVFLYFLLKLKEYFINKNGFTGSGIKHLDKNWFKNLAIYIPTSLEEQSAIASILSTADSEISLLNKKLNLLKTQKKGLMQQLLTDKIRVNANHRPSGEVGETRTKSAVETEGVCNV